MADDFGDKTEAPTPRRREEAREQGQVAKSTDLVAALSLVTSVYVLGWFGPALASDLQRMMQETFAPDVIGNLSPSSAGPLGLRALSAAALAVAPIVICVMLAAIFGNLFQVGLHLTPNRLMPKLESLNPLKGAKRLMGGPQAFVGLGFNLLKLGIVGFIGYTAVHNRLPEIVGVQKLDFIQAFGLVASLTYSIALRVAVVLLVIAILDYAWKKFKHERDLRMTKQQVKDEMKRMEGDPMIKHRRRQIAMQMSRDRQKQAVPTADVVVTNPTEYAVALKYDPASGNAPRVVAKGRGLIAAEIRRIAISNGVPILERPPLARALFKLCEVGQEIPEEFYSTVAEILAYVYELTGKLRKGRPQNAA